MAGGKKKRRGGGKVKEELILEEHLFQDTESDCLTQLFL